MHHADIHFPLNTYSYLLCWHSYLPEYLPWIVKLLLQNTLLDWSPGLWVPPYALLNIAIAVFVHTGKLTDAIVLLCLFNVYVALVLSFVWRLSKLPRTSQRTTSLFSPQGYHEALRIEDEESGNSLQSLETESSKGQVPVHCPLELSVCWFFWSEFSSCLDSSAFELYCVAFRLLLCARSMSCWWFYRVAYCG